MGQEIMQYKADSPATNSARISSLLSWSLMVVKCKVCIQAIFCWWCTKFQIYKLGYEKGTTALINHRV